MSETTLRGGLGGLLRKIVLAGSVAVSSFGLNGCGSMNQNQRTGLALSLLGGSVSGLGARKGDLGAVAYGQAISNHGAAMANQSQVEQNVYVQPQNQQPQQTREYSNNQSQIQQNNRKKEFRADGFQTNLNPKFGETWIGTFNYFNDFNKDNLAAYDELIGKKSKFSKDEKITCLFWSEKLRSELNFKLFNQNGDIIDGHDKDEFNSLGIHNKAKFVWFKPSHFKEGNYVAAWYSGDEFIDKIEFGVIDSSASGN